MNCSNCNSEFGVFRWKHECCGCEGVFCSKCLKSFYGYKDLVVNTSEAGDYCSNCWGQQVAPVVEKYKTSQQNASSVELVSVNYKGKINIDQNVQPTILKSSWYKNREDAESSLKLSAAFLGCDTVLEFALEKNSKDEPSNTGKGRYTRSIWRATGKAVCTKK